MSSPDRLEALENRVMELERLMATQMQRQVEFPGSLPPEVSLQVPDYVSDPELALEPSQPCCSKRRALEAMWQAYGPEPLEEVILQLQLHWRKRKEGLNVPTEPREEGGTGLPSRGPQPRW